MHPQLPTSGSDFARPLAHGDNGRPGPLRAVRPGRPHPGRHRSAPAPSAPSAPAVLTQDDTGRTVTLALDDTTQLRLSGRWRETAPTVDGRAVVLVPVDYETDPGFRAWDVRAAEPGEAVLRTTGQEGLRPLRITFRVG
ncbi:hypothetical protein [Streptomyces sp. NPDC057740]|uniref:hypothetical protein n=1 Tax=Streptomyces sp. NPDC057740 TaxID=3346234 RepID=UPI0036BA4008